MIRLLSDDINKPIIKQYLDMYMKSAAYNLSNSCDSKIVSRNSHLKSPYQVFLMLSIKLFLPPKQCQELGKKSWDCFIFK